MIAVYGIHLLCNITWIKVAFAKKEDKAGLIKASLLVNYGRPEEFVSIPF